MGIIIINLTNRAPVKIEEGDWPLITTANKCVTHPPTIAHEASLSVRRSADGRTLIYGTADQTSPCQHWSVPVITIREGILIDDPEDTPDAIRRVENELLEKLRLLGGSKTSGTLENHIRVSADECIRSLPPESLDALR